MTVILVTQKWCGLGCSRDANGVTARLGWLMVRAAKGSIAESALMLAQELEKSKRGDGR